MSDDRLHNKPIGRPCVYRAPDGAWIGACRSSPAGSTGGTYRTWQDAMNWATRPRPRRWLQEAVRYS